MNYTLSCSKIKNKKKYERLTDVASSYGSIADEAGSYAQARRKGKQTPTTRY